VSRSSTVNRLSWTTELDGHEEARAGVAPLTWRRCTSIFEVTSQIAALARAVEQVRDER
jgi:hypothetical protein